MVPDYLAHIKPIDERYQEEPANIPYAPLYHQSDYDAPGDLDRWYTNGYGQAFSPRYEYDNDGFAIPNGAFTDVWTGRPTDGPLSEVIRKAVFARQLEQREVLKQLLDFDQEKYNELRRLGLK